MLVDLGIYKFRGRQKLPESLGPGFGDLVSTRFRFANPQAS
jgi:hypothetical protein